MSSKLFFLLLMTTVTSTATMATAVPVGHVNIVVNTTPTSLTSKRMFLPRGPRLQMTNDTSRSQPQVGVTPVGAAVSAQNERRATVQPSLHNFSATLPRYGLSPTALPTNGVSPTPLRAAPTTAAPLMSSNSNRSTNWQQINRQIKPADHGTNASTKIPPQDVLMGSEAATNRSSDDLWQMLKRSLLSRNESNDDRLSGRWAPSDDNKTVDNHANVINGVIKLAPEGRNNRSQQTGTGQKAGIVGETNMTEVPSRTTGDPEISEAASSQNSTATVESSALRVANEKSALGYNDTTSAGHNDTTSAGHNDTTSAGHNDTTYVGHNDTTYVGHNDTTYVGHSDTTFAGHSDTTSVGHNDTTSVGHNDTTSAGFNDTTSVGHNDTTSAGHNDTPYAVHNDTTVAGHKDTMVTGHNDTTVAGHNDTTAGGRSAVKSGASQRFGAEEELSLNVTSTGKPAWRDSFFDDDGPSTENVDVPAPRLDVPAPRLDVPHGRKTAPHAEWSTRPNDRRFMNVFRDTSSHPRHHGYVPHSIHGLYWEDRRYVISVLMPICGGVVGASVIVCVAYVCRSCPRNSAKTFEKRAAPSAFSCPPNDQIFLLAESSDEEQSY